MEGEVTVPTAAKRCRCCMTPGIAFKDLSLEYEWMGEKEVYADMLLESFDVTLERNTKAGWTICDACISRLRDSSNFKKQVLYSERCLLQGLFPSDEKTLSIVYKPKEPAEMKLESQSEGDDAEEFETHYLDEDLDLDEDVKEIKQEPIASTSEMSNDEDTPLSSLRPMKVKSKVAAKVKSKTIGKKAIKITVPPEKLTVKKLIQRQKLTTKPQLKPKPNVKILESSSSHKLIKLSTKPVSVIKKGAVSERARNRRELEKARANWVILIENATVYPFKWSKSLFACYYCKEKFVEATDMRTHVLVHDPNTLAEIIYKERKDRAPIKLDISCIRCRICDEQFDSLELVKLHLPSHKKSFHPGIVENVLPFRLNGRYDCVVCGSSENCFFKLICHVSSHFANYICDHCGETLNSLVKVATHQRMHSDRVYRCNMCPEYFNDWRKKMKHLKKVHQVMRHKCPRCNMRFLDGKRKKVHMIKVHNATELLSQCEACGKSYQTKYNLRNHQMNGKCTGKRNTVV